MFRYSWPELLAVLTLSQLRITDAFSPSPLSYSDIRTGSDKRSFDLSLPSSLLEDTSTSISEYQDIPANSLNLKGDGNISSKNSLDWSFVDKVYLITCPNADDNSERLNKAKGILEKVGLLDQIEVKEFDTDDEDRIRGCYASHISVLKDAMNDIKAIKENSGEIRNEKDWLSSIFSMFENESTKEPNADNNNEDVSSRPKCVMVLEDNLELTGNLNNACLSAVNKYLEDDGEADMIHLSYIPYVPNLKVTATEEDNIVKLSTGIGSALGTTAYIIKEDGIKQLLQEDKEKGYYAAIPDIMALKFPESRVSLYPTPFLRAPKTKSLVNPQLDDLRTVLFQPWFVSQFQNALAITGLSTNTLFFSTIGSLLVVSGISFKGVFDAGFQIVNYGEYQGNLLFPVVNGVFAIFCLGILALGASLAPKPPVDPSDEDTSQINKPSIA